MKKKKTVLGDIIRNGYGDAFDPKLKVMVVLSCIAADVISLHATYNAMFRQDKWLNWAVVIICALCLELFPVALATIMSRGKKNRIEWGLIITILAAFITEVVLYFCIRMRTGDVLFGAAVQQEPVWGAHKFILLLLGLLPALTSIIAFAVTYMNPEIKREEILENQLLTLKEEINKKQVEIGLVEEDLKERDLRKLDETRFATANLLADLVEIGSQIKVAQILAAQLNDVDATTMLTENNDIETQLEKAREKLEELTKEAA